MHHGNPNVQLVNMKVSSAYISIGGNRNPAAADWDEGASQLLAFGADNSIALWDPQASLTYA
jgi:elongator complex protein 2